MVGRTAHLVPGSSIIGESASLLENILVQVRRKGKTLNSLGVHFAPGPARFKDGVDGVNDPVVTHNVGGIRCSTGVVVELSNHGFVDVDLSELLSCGKLVAVEGFDFSGQLISVKILWNNVGQDNFLAQITLVGLNSRVGRGKDRERSDSSEELGDAGLVDGILEEIEVVVFLNVDWTLSLEFRKVTVADTWTFQSSKGTQNTLVTAVFSERVGIGVYVVRRHVKSRRLCRELWLDGMEGRSRSQIQSDESGDLHGAIVVCIFK